jgi:hypothetical protein
MGDILARLPADDRVARWLTTRPKVLALLRDLKAVACQSGRLRIHERQSMGGPINQSEWPKDHWSVAMIERSYGRFLAKSGDRQRDLLGDLGDTGEQHQIGGHRTRKTRDLGGRVSGLRRKTQAG